jgi:ATP-dependent DNA helicase DinG
MKLLDKDLQPYTLRKEQIDCQKFIFDKLHNEPIKKFFLLDLPTGTGKSILALSIIQKYLKEIDKDAKFDVLTESKLLQRQYQDDFNSMSNLAGKNSYICTQFSCSCEQGKEFQKISKSDCEDCPYDSAKDQFMGGRISLTNFHMYTVMSMNKLLDRRESNVLIVDEAHELENVVSNFVSVTLSQKNLISMGFDDVDVILRNMKSINVISDFVDFCQDYLLERIDKQVSILGIEVKSNDEKVFKRELNIDSVLDNTQNNSSVKLSRNIENLNSIKSKIINFLEEYKNDFTNWDFQVEYDDNKLKLVIQPIWAYPFFEKYIWKKYDKVFLMSGTILNKNMFNYLNGIPEPLSEYYMIDSPFLTKDRPIYYIPVGKMNFKQKEQTFKKFIPVINKLLSKYKNKKGIIHTVTFELQKWLDEGIKSDRFLLPSSDQKSKNFALKQHYTTDKPTILVSPSMGTGVDLKNDRARFQICLKVPYPNLGSTKNKKRMKDKPEWYAWLTVTKIIQLYGRAVRNDKDSAHFIILDSCFGDVLRYSGHLFPGWVLRAIKEVDHK